MKISRNYVIIGIGILILACISFFLFRETREGRLMAQGNEYIDKINRYLEDTGRLPASLQELGLEERLEGPIYYERRDSAHFVLWFGTSVGESVTYDSRTKSWN